MEMGQGRTVSYAEYSSGLLGEGEKFASRLCFISLVSQNNADTHVTHLDYKVPRTPITVHYKITVRCLFLYYSFRNFF